jgi:predicted dehydrogenase
MYPHILDVLKALPSLKGILLNIPVTLNSARLTEILDYCDAAHIAVQMNIWRRGVPLYQELSHRDILKDIGSVLSASALHQGAPVTDLSSGQAGGCGLLPMLDFIQWLFGAAEKVTTLKGCADGHAHNIPFVLHIPDHIHVHVHPLSTASYCENAFDFWGTKSRISITQNGLLRTIYPCVPSRSFSKQHELAADRPIQSKVPVGNAIYHLYHNLASHIQEGAPLLAPGRAYLQTLHTYESLCHAAKQHFESGVSTPVSLPVPYAPP